MTGDISSPMLTRKMCKSGGLKDLQSGLLACFLSQNDPKKVLEALKESSWIEAILDTSDSHPTLSNRKCTG